VHVLIHMSLHYSIQFCSFYFAVLFFKVNYIYCTIIQNNINIFYLNNLLEIIDFVPYLESSHEFYYSVHDHQCTHA